MEIISDSRDVVWRRIGLLARRKRGGDNEEERGLGDIGGVGSLRSAWCDELGVLFSKLDMLDTSQGTGEEVVRWIFLLCIAAGVLLDIPSGGCIPL